jgi:branched-chain amino acid aminotransferase
MRRVLRANRLLHRDAAVRLTISRGAGPVGLLPPAHLRSTTLLLAMPIDPRLAAAQKRGVAVCFAPLRFVNSTLPRHKTLNYLTAVLGKMIAMRRNAWEAVCLASDGSVLEGTTSNVFIVRGGGLVTPPLHGILPGVTRAVLVAIARRAHIPLSERPITRAELLAADEIFLTASTIEILPVVRVERRRIGDGKPGAVTRALQARYRQHVEDHCGVVGGASGGSAPRARFRIAFGGSAPAAARTDGRARVPGAAACRRYSSSSRRSEASGAVKVPAKKLRKRARASVATEDAMAKRLVSASSKRARWSSVKRSRVAREAT